MNNLQVNNGGYPNNLAPSGANSSMMNNKVKVPIIADADHNGEMEMMNP